MATLSGLWKGIPTTRKFQVSSALSLIVVFLILFPVLSSIVKDYYIDLNPQIIIDDVQILARTTLDKDDFTSYGLPEVQEHFDELDKLLRKRRVHKVEIWDKNGRIIFSENKSSVGLLNPNNERFQQAMQGIAVIEIDTLTLDNYTHTENEQIVVMFVPIMYPGVRGPSGVVEVHQRVTTLKGILYTTRIQLVALFFVSLIIIYVALNALYLEAERGMKEAIRHLEEMNAKKNDFISITAHELKTPITVVSGSCEMLNKHMKKMPRNMKEYLTMIDREIHRMNSLITEMLDISRIDLHTVEFVYNEEDVPDFMRKGVKELEPIMKKNKVKLDLRIDPEVGKAVIDSDRVWQVILNLVMNAVKFSPKGKSIYISIESKGKMLAFSVQDEGPGIAKEFQDKIFSRLYQVDPAKTRGHGGLGLGLAICKGLIQEMGGKIWVKSEPGKGAMFTFTVPIEGVKGSRTKEMF